MFSQVSGPGFSYATSRVGFQLLQGQSRRGRGLAAVLQSEGAGCKLLVDWNKEGSSLTPILSHCRTRRS